jgi:spore coat protein CotF
MELNILKAQLTNMIEHRCELISLYEKMPSLHLQDKIIDLGKKIGTLSSMIREKEFYNAYQRINN